MNKVNRKNFQNDYDMFASDDYVEAKNNLTKLFSSNVIDDRIKIDNLFLFSDPKLLSRLLFLILFTKKF